MSLIAVAVNDVLCSKSWRVNEAGRNLVLGFLEFSRVVLLLDHGDVDRFKMWARLEGIRGYVDVVPDTVPTALRGYDLRTGQVEYLEGRGTAVDLLIDNDPDRVAAAMKNGINCLLFCDAKFQRGEFRPDFEGEYRSWDDLKAEIEHQHLLSTDLADAENSAQH